MTEVAEFQIRIADEKIQDLESRLHAARWVEDAEHIDWEPGPPPYFVRGLCDYWLHNFDWRQFEERINREPQVSVETNGLSLHAIHRRSSRADAIPLLLLHGWPGAFIEYLELCRPLAEPGPGEPAFHVVVPSLPGFGFSSTRHGVATEKIASYLVTLMESLGYPRFMIQGGNWGGLIGTQMARQFPDRVSALHLSSISGNPPAEGEDLEISEEEKSWIVEPASFPHFALLTQKPATAAYALNDSPMGLAAWIGEKLYDWADNPRSDEPALSREQMLQIIALYWFTGTIGSSMRLYYEHFRNLPHTHFVDVPTAAALFPRSIAKIPRAWAEGHYNITRWTVFDRGGHFPALEVPELLLEDIRAFAGEIMAV